MNWTLLPFKNLTVDQLYDIIHLREKIFVVEQNCAYQEADGYDKIALHLMGMKGDALACYARIIPPATPYHGNTLTHDAIIGRVIADPAFRGEGLGHLLMSRALAAVAESFGAATPVTISAQAHLQGFYSRHGFVAFGQEYLEDNIPHRAMRRVPQGVAA